MRGINGGKKKEKKEIVLLCPDQSSQLKVSFWHQDKRGNVGKFVGKPNVEKPDESLIWDLEGLKTGLEDLDG